MTQVINRKTASRLAGLELNALIATGTIPHAPFAGGRISGSPTAIYDLNGEILFYRTAVRGRATAAFVDIAASHVFGATLLRVGHGMPWDEKDLIRAAEAAAAKAMKGKRYLRYDQAKFVAYSYPKIAVQFLAAGEEVVMIELGSWKVVPQRRQRREKQPPGNFERFSLIDEYPPRPRDGEKRIVEHVRQWEEVTSGRAARAFDVRTVDPERFRVALEDVLILGRTDTRRVAYSPVTTDHVPCYELRGQLTNVWCVAASVQMVLDFYRYNYAQTRIASDLGLGTISNPNGLPYANDSYVVTVLENLTSNALDANMNTSPNWTEFRDEVRANRPTVSFIPGHSRSVAGYTATGIFSWYSFRGLLVYDPWPPSTGVITQWENFSAMTYRRTFTAHLTLV